MTKIVVYGSNGQLGWELMRRFKRLGVSAKGMDLPHDDVTDKDGVQFAIRSETPQIIINASAYTAVDQAETERETAFKVNRDGPAYIAQACSHANIPLIHVSTDYVFDGTSHVPYKEDDLVAPMGVYGESKEKGECGVRKCLTEHIIIRTSWVYGVHGHNFVKTMVRLGKENPRIKVVDDQYGCPTYAGDLADAIISIVDLIQTKGRANWGTYHYCGEGVTTWYGFAEKIFELVEQYIPLKVTEVLPISTAEYPTPAKRPAYSALDCNKIKKHWNVVPKPWQKSLEAMIDDLFKDD